MFFFLPAQRVLIRSFTALCFGVVIFGGIRFSHALGKGPQANKPFVYSEERLLPVNNDRVFRYHLDYFVNRHGEREMKVSLIEAHWLAKDTRLVVLRGRDTDSDNLIDVWFYSEDGIVKSIKKSAKSADAWWVASDLLRDFSLNESRWISTLVSRELFAELFFTVDGELEDTKELEQMQIDLHDLDHKILALEKNQENPALIQELKRIDAEGWKRLLDRWDRTRIEDRHERIMGDVAFFIAGGVALKGVKFLLVKGLSSEAMSSIKAYLSNAIEQQEIWLRNLSSRVEKMMPQKSVVEATAVESEKSSSVLRFGSESEALAWLSNKTYFSKSLQKMGGLIKEVGVGVWDQKAYIAVSQTIQFAVESYNRGYWKFSEEPLILSHPVATTPDFMGQVTNDKGLMQNLSYMTLQTSLLSSVDEALEHKGHGFKVKYPTCAMITFVDSMAVNVLINGNSDLNRVGFDTGWELFVGTPQVLLDKYMLKKVKAYAEKFKSPKLRYAGFLLTSIDQLVGYTLYNKATSALFEAPHGGAVTGTQVQNKAVPPVVVIPILAPK